MKATLKAAIFPLLFFIISLPVSAQIKLDQPIPTDPDVKIGKLENGLTYYIRRNPKPENKVELRLAVNAGSVLEDPDQLGLAHFMEHMGFNGSKNFPKNELVGYLQQTGVKFGADLNAYTSFDETVYILPIPSDDPEVLEKGFTVLEDWAFNNLFDKEEIEKERGVVLEELRLSKGASERMRRKYLPRLFNGSLYAERLPIGKDSVLKTFKPETLERFYKQWYRPNLMAVVVVGDIDPAEAEKKVKAHFGSYKNPADAPARPEIIPIPQRTAPEAMVLTDNEATSTSLQIYNYVRPEKPVRTWGDYRQKIVEGLMSAMINQRLQEITQQENPPFLYGYTGMGSFLRGYETFVSYAAIGSGTVKEAVNALMAETERARQFGFLESEFSRAKTTLLSQAENAYKEIGKMESSSLVDLYVANFLNDSPIPGVENRYEFIKQILPGISLNEINAVAAKMPDSENAFTLLMAPENRKESLPSSEELLKTIVEASKMTLEAYHENAIAENLLDKTPVSGKIIKETKNDKLGTTDLTFSNGITVTLKPTAFKNDQILMDGWRWGGWHKFNLTDKENAENAAVLVNVMGLKDLSPTDLRKFLAGKTLEIHPYINPDEEGIEGSSSVKDFETFLQLAHLYFTQPRKDESLFQSYVNRQKSQVKFIMQNPRAFFSDTLTKIIYNNNPWAGGIPNEAYYDKLNADRALAIYKQIFSNAYGMHFTFVGNINPAEVKPLLAKYLGSLPAAKKENSFKDVGLRQVKGTVNAAVKKGQEQQSIIALKFGNETKYTLEDEIALDALIEALNIEVIEKLREEMGGIYGGGFSGSISKRPFVHYSISAAIPCGPENVDKLSNALIELIKDAREKGIEQKTLDKVKETWRKHYKESLENNGFWLQSLSSSWINRDDPENILKYEQRVNALTLEDIQQAARKYLDLNNYVKAVLYPEE